MCVHVKVIVSPASLFFTANTARLTKVPALAALNKPISVTAPVPVPAGNTAEYVTTFVATDPPAAVRATRAISVPSVVSPTAAATTPVPHAMWLSCAGWPVSFCRAAIQFLPTVVIRFLNVSSAMTLPSRVWTTRIWPLDVRKINGIGPKAGAKLNALGIDTTVLAGIINSSTGRCWSSEMYNPWPGIVETAPASRGYTGGFGAELMLKDLGLATEAARQAHQPVVLGAVAQQLYQAMSQRGEGGKDFSAIINSYRKPQ